MSRPGLVTRFTLWVRSLPVSPWVFYPALFAAWVLFDLIAWGLAGALPQGSWSLRSLYDTFSGGAFAVSVLAFYFYLDEAIAESADDSRVISGLSDSQFARFRHELIVIPLWPELLVGAVFGVASVQAAMFQQGFNELAPSMVLYLLDWVLAAVIGFGFAFRVLRLIVLIGRFYAGPVNLNLFNLPPLYELTTVVGKAALFFLLLWYVNIPLSLNEFILRSPAALASLTVIALIPLAAFLVPQAVLSRRLAREKTRLIVDVSLQLQSAFQQLKRNLDSKALEDVDRIRPAIEALIAESKYIDAIPTWPWRLATFRIAVTAVILPVLVWLIQQVLDRVFAL